MEIIITKLSSSFDQCDPCDKVTKYVLPPKTISYVAFVFMLLLPHLSGTICFSIAVLFREK